MVGALLEVGSLAHPERVEKGEELDVDRALVIRVEVERALRAAPRALHRVPVEGDAVEIEAVHARAPDQVRRAGDVVVDPRS
eukprot:1969128-Pleurochrysis_carterae.AAC.2